tara:strand:- start:1454 stop:2827 length:1374 start_codon:yes stop_codon:yes gene_type:complete
MKPARYATPRNPKRKTQGPMLQRVAENLGFELFEWQKEVANTALELDDNGHFFYRTCGATVGRQNGKTTLLVFRIALELLKSGTMTIYTSQDRNQARHKFDEHVELLMGTPFKKRIKKYVRANGQEALYMNNGSSYRVVTPNSTGARGLSVDLACIDEALTHDLRLVSAIQPTMATKPSAQLWITSNAGGPYSTLLQHYRKLGHEKSPALCWHEWTPYKDDFDMFDENVWYEAIPTLGEEAGVTLPAVQEAVQTTDPQIFAQEWLNVWPSLVTQTVIDADKWDKLIRHDVQIQNYLVFGVDVSPDRDRASIGAAGINGAFTALEVIESENRIGWLKDRILELHVKWRMPFVIDSGAAASSLIGELEAEGVSIIPINMRQYGQACGSFYDAVEEGTIAHLGDIRLQTAIEGATKRKLGEQWAWSRKSNVDITPLVACTIARYALVAGLTAPEPKGAIH